MSDISALERQILDAIAAAGDEAGLDAVRVGALGKKGSISELLKTLGGMSPEQRKTSGPAFNGLRDRVSQAIAARKGALETAALNTRLAAERIDITLPVRPEPTGSVHPVSQVLDEVVAIFADLGFAVAEGPDVEFDDYNFTKLNTPPDHPARQMQDTFYMAAQQADGSRHVLRTQTSAVQVRTMLVQQPPIRIISPGRTYRCDSDATHSPMFHQIEGLVVDETTHLGHLKWTLEEFLKAFFEIDHAELRARPSYFPFTEPSLEWDVRCDRSGGHIKFGTGNDWLEIFGSGMVNPRVLENCGIASGKYQGYAFGGGIDRLAMLKYGIADIRSFFESDLRWLRAYGFSALDIPSLDGGLSR